MAEITTTPAKANRRLQTPRIDLTPMVDLAFLLITFFIFTATLSEPTAMTTLLPAKSTDSSHVARSGAITLIPTKEKLILYQGSNPTQTLDFNYNDPTALRTQLLTIQQQLLQTYGNDDKLFVMIKPTNQAAFMHIVQLLDEMKICQIKSYTITDMDEMEIATFGAM